MIIENKFLYSAILLSLTTGIFLSSEKIIFEILIILGVIRLIYFKNWRILFFSILLIVVLSFKMAVKNNVKQELIKEYPIFKIYPTDLKKVKDIYIGTANIGRSKYSILINSSKKIDQKKNKIIYLRALDFTQEDISLPRNIGEFNYKNYYRSKGISEKIIVNNYIIKNVPAKSLYEKILLYRWQLKEYFNRFPSSLSFNTKSLILGYSDSNIETDTNFKNLSKLGIIHLFSLSGMHLMLIVGFLKKVVSYFKIITVQSLDYILIGILPIYCIFVGAKTSICRATILIIVKIVFEKLNKKTSQTEIFAISLITGLFIDPYCLSMLGGQLTYILSLALIYLGKLNRFKLSVVINLLCAPLVILNNYEINSLVIIINIVALPIFEMFILPSTFLVAVVGPNNIKIINFFEYVNNQIYLLLDKVANISLFNVITGKINILIVILTLLFGICIISTKNKIRKKILAKVSFGLLVINIILNKYPIFGQVTFIDVGQGDSILITTPVFRKTLLIDTGGKLNFGKFTRKDKSYGVIKSTIPYLKYQGISQIDAIFLSHKDADHIGDLEKILTNFKVKEIYMGSGVQNNPNIKKMLQPLSNKIQLHLVLAGDKINYGTVKFKILAPIVPGIGTNEDSMVIYSKIGAKNWLFTGDLDRKNEIKIYNKFHPRVDYLKVGHHGSKTSSDPGFIKNIHPQKAFISVAKKNRYGHPNKETLDTLKKNKVEIYKTADYGMITWRFNLLNQYKLEFYLGDKNEY